MAKTPKPVRKLKKDAATAKRVGLEQEKQKRPVAGIPAKHFATPTRKERADPSKPTPQAKKATERSFKAYDVLSEKGNKEFAEMGKAARDTPTGKAYKALGDAGKAQIKAYQDKGKASMTVFPGGPRKGVVPGGITKAPKGRGK